MKSTGVTDVPLGTILPGRRQFIKTVSVTSESAPFTVELPGHITRCEGQTGFALKPYARLVSRAGDYRRSAVLTASVADEPGLDLALAPFREKLAARAPTEFAVRLASRLSVGEAFAALEKTPRLRLRWQQRRDARARLDRRRPRLETRRGHLVAAGGRGHLPRVALRPGGRLVFLRLSLDLVRLLRPPH
jgi:hypothetical protein